MTDHLAPKTVVATTDIERAFTDACDEAGCAYDNEALLKAISDLKVAALRTSAQRCEGGEAVPAAWMSSAELASFAIDRERYPGGGAGDLATARYMKADFFDVPLYAHPPVVAEREEIARIIDPTAFHLLDELAKPESDGFPGRPEANNLANKQAETALAKADAILSLTPDASRIRELEGALEDAIPLLETLHSLIPVGEARRFAFTKIKKARAALSSATKAAGEEKR